MPKEGFKTVLNSAIQQLTLFGYRPKDPLFISNCLTSPDYDKVYLELKDHNLAVDNAKTRYCQATTLPVYYAGAVQPHPDCGYTFGAMDGIGYRAGRKLPLRNPNFIQEFKKYIKNHLLEEFKYDKVKYDEDLNIDEWLDKTNYNEARKEELRKVYKELNTFQDKKNFIVKVFTKDEFYPDLKWFRGIYARDDKAKVIFGPIVKEIEEVVYQHPAFIKKIPVEQRPNYIKQRLFHPEGRYFATDYSSFESHFDKSMMRDIECWFYKKLLSKGSQKQRFLIELLGLVTGGINHITSKFFTGMIEAKRMSGEMNTSLGNSLMNYFLICFWAHLNGVKVIAIVEGDDGLFTVITDKDLDVKIFEDMGCSIKIESYSDVGEAGFCQAYFDVEECINLVDPRKVLMNFGWTKRKYLRAKFSTKMQLLRAKALSLLCQYKGCPIVHPLAVRLLELTRSYNVSDKVWESFGLYRSDMVKEMVERSNIKELINFKITERSRSLMDRKFGIPKRLQIQMEQIVSRFGLGGNPSSLLAALLPSSSIHYYHEYSLDGLHDKISFGEYDPNSANDYYEQFKSGVGDLETLMESLKREKQELKKNKTSVLRASNIVVP